MSHSDISEIAGRIIADATIVERREGDLRDAVADLFVRLTDGLSETATSLIAFLVNRRLGVCIV